jgi:dTDP-4-amino-4,6-dideoxygalactose transaminase
VGDEGDGTAAAWYYEQNELGFNYRLTDIHAALGVSQLQRLSTYIEQRNVLARRYDELLRDLGLLLPTVREGNISAFHLYVVRLKPGEHAKTRRQAFDELRRAGIAVNLHYSPVHLQPYYRALGFAPGQYPEAESYGREALTLPLYPGLTFEQQDEVVHGLRRVLAR